MRQRGRKSAAELKVIPGAFGEGRPPPPKGLTDPQADIWRDTVATEPVDFFASAATKALLVDYCRHRASADVVSRLIDAFQAEWLKEPDGPKRYRELLRTREGETRAAVTMATKLRLTNQARVGPKAAATAGRDAARAARPWEA